MKLQKLNPWNWFKDEESRDSRGGLEVKRTTDTNSPVPRSADQAYHPVIRLQQEVDRLFDDVFSAFDALGGVGRPLRRGWLTPGTEWPKTDVYRPSIDVSGDDKSYEVTLDVPGLTEADLSLEVRGDVLAIKGQKQESKEEENKDKQFYRIERRYGAFQRTLSLPDDANASDISATLKNGVLKLIIPRRELSEKEVKQIAIN